MSRTIVNFCIDCLAAFLFLAMIATGYILRFPLPPGTNKLYSLWGLTRHEWGSIHFWISLALLTVIFIHVAMHWSWIVSVVRKRLFHDSPQGYAVAKSGFAVFAGMTVIFSVFAVAAERSVDQISGSRPEVCPPDDQTSNQKGKVSRENSKALGWKEISPIFYKNCVSCHGEKMHFADFRADRYEDFFKQIGASPLITPGNVSESALLEIVKGDRRDMPAYEKHLLRDDEIRKLTEWIASGARE